MGSLGVVAADNHFRENCHPVCLSCDGRNHIHVENGFLYPS